MEKLLCTNFWKMMSFALRARPVPGWRKSPENCSSSARSTEEKTQATPIPQENITFPHTGGLRELEPRRHDNTRASGVGRCTGVHILLVDAAW